MKKNVDISKHINSVTIALNDKEMEFIDEIATQLTELNFHEDSFIPIQCENNVNETSGYMFTAEAQDFYNERYDEIESLYINLIKTK